MTDPDFAMLITAAAFIVIPAVFFIIELLTGLRGE